MLFCPAVSGCCFHRLSSSHSLEADQDLRPWPTSQDRERGPAARRPVTDTRLLRGRAYPPAPEGAVRPRDGDPRSLKVTGRLVREELDGSAAWETDVRTLAGKPKTRWGAAPRPQVPAARPACPRRPRGTGGGRAAACQRQWRRNERPEAHPAQRFKWRVLCCLFSTTA